MVVAIKKMFIIWFLIGKVVLFNMDKTMSQLPRSNITKVFRLKDKTINKWFEDYPEVFVEEALRINHKTSRRYFKKARDKITPN